MLFNSLLDEHISLLMILRTSLRAVSITYLVKRLYFLRVRTQKSKQMAKVACSHPEHSLNRIILTSIPVSRWSRKEIPSFPRIKLSTKPKQGSKYKKSKVLSVRLLKFGEFRDTIFPKERCKGCQFPRYL